MEAIYDSSLNSLSLSLLIVLPISLSPFKRCDTIGYDFQSQHRVETSAQLTYTVPKYRDADS